MSENPNSDGRKKGDVCYTVPHRDLYEAKYRHETCLGDVMWLDDEEPPVFLAPEIVD